MLDIWAEFVIPFANAVVAVPLAVVANVNAEFAVVVVADNSLSINEKWAKLSML